MKRYIVFIGCPHYPVGGAWDIFTDTDDLEYAKSLVDDEDRELEGYCFGHVLDTGLEIKPEEQDWGHTKKDDELKHGIVYSNHKNHPNF